MFLLLSSVAYHQIMERSTASAIILRGDNQLLIAITVYLQKPVFGIDRDGYDLCCLQQSMGGALSHHSGVYLAPWQSGSPSQSR